MLALLQNLFGVSPPARARIKSSGRKSGGSAAARAPFRPRLEALEERRLMTVTNLGGPVLPHVEVQPVYLGTQWTTPGSAANGMVGPQRHGRQRHGRPSFRPHPGQPNGDWSMLAMGGVQQVA
jgi:hypothetical protein